VGLPPTFGIVHQKDLSVKEGDDTLKMFAYIGYALCVIGVTKIIIGSYMVGKKKGRREK